MSVGRTNALRAGNFTSEVSSTEKWLAPPHVSYIIGFCTTWGSPRHPHHLRKSFQVVTRADLAAPPVCPLLPLQFVHSHLPSFSTGFLSDSYSDFFYTALGLIFSVLLHSIQCAKLVIFSVIGHDKRVVLSYFLCSF